MGFPWVSRCASEAHSDELPVSIWWYCNWCRSRIVCRRGPSPLLQRPLRSAVAQFFCDQNCTELLVSSHFHAWLCKSCHELPILHRYATHSRHSASPIAICNTAIRLLDLQSAIADALHNLTCPCGMHHHENERQEILPLFIDIIITLIVQQQQAGSRWRERCCRRDKRSDTSQPQNANSARGGENEKSGNQPWTLNTEPKNVPAQTSKVVWPWTRGSWQQPPEAQWTDLVLCRINIIEICSIDICIYI